MRSNADGLGVDYGFERGGVLVAMIVMGVGTPPAEKKEGGNICGPAPIVRSATPPSVRFALRSRH